MAGAPTWLEKINFIKFYVSNPCNFPFVVYYETLWPVAGKTSISLLTFGMGDMVRGFFRPKGLRSGRHGRKRRRKKPGRELIPEIAELIAKPLSNGLEVSGRQVTDGVKNLWVIDNFGQRLLYYLLIFNVVLDFWYDWNVAIIKDERSKCNGIGRGLAHDTEHLHNPGGLGSLITLDIRYSELPVSMSFGGVSVGVGSYIIVLTANATKYQPMGVDAECQLAIRNADNHEQFFAWSARKPVKHLETVSLIATAHVTGPANVEIMALTKWEAVMYMDIWHFVYQADGG